MTWEIKVHDEFQHDILADIVDELCDVLEEAEVDPRDDSAVNEEAWNAVHEVVDGRFIYTVDQLAAILYYGHVEDGMNATWDALMEDVVEQACEKYCL